LNLGRERVNPAWEQPGVKAAHHDCEQNAANEPQDDLPPWDGFQNPAENRGDEAGHEDDRIPDCAGPVQPMQLETAFEDDPATILAKSRP
jgi:hypothetical protein